MLFRENGKIYQTRAAGWYLAREPKKKNINFVKAY